MNIKVVKRDGRIVAFDEERIRTAIEKGLASVNSDHPLNVDRVLNNVIQNIEDFNSSKIEIERIQDFVEEAFLDCGFIDAYKSFKRYRKDRAIAREHFSKGQHKLLKTIENLNASESLDDVSTKNLMFEFGSALSNSYAEAYLLKEDVNKAQSSKDIFVHDLEYYAMGTTSSVRLPLDKLFKGGFRIGNTNIRKPQSIESYTALCAKAIQANLNDQHGEQIVSMFDCYMAKGVLKSFKKNYIKELEDYHDFTGLLSDLEVVEITNKINDLKEISSLQIEDLDIVYKKALALTDKQTYQAIEALMFNLNTITTYVGKKPLVTFGFGTDTTIEGRMVSKNLILVKESDGSHNTLVSPTLVFKCKEGINYETHDPNFDLFKLAIRCNTKGNVINFSFIDLCLDKTTKSNLSSTTINLPRLGIKHSLTKEGEIDAEGFYEELYEVMDLVKYQLIDRLKFQKQKKVKNFPFLMGQHVWPNADNLKDEDMIGDVLNEGSLSIGFIGLPECLKALTGKTIVDDETNKLGLEIVSKIRNKCNQYSKETGLNFVCFGSDDLDIGERFISSDKEMYGDIEDVTDKQSYTGAFHVPSTCDISIEEKLAIEGPYFELINGGAIECVELNPISTNIDEVERIIRLAHDSSITQITLKIK